MIPKFKVWDKVSHAWIYDIYIGLDGRAKDLSRTGEEPFELNLDNVIIIQSAGLLDVNGEEIFEGDVVASTWFKDYYNLVGYRKLGKVIYRNGCFCIEYPGDVERGYPPTILNFAIDVEIIGNIFENPELMEVGDDTEV